MAGKRRGRKIAKPKETNNDATIEEEMMVDKNENEFQDQEEERQVDAIRALRDAEVQQLMVMLRLLRSYFSEEEQKRPVLDIFREKLPNISIMKNEENGEFEVQWKDENGSFLGSQAGGGNIDASLLHGLSMLYRDLPTANLSVGGSEFSDKSVKTGIQGVETLQIPGFNLEEPSGSRQGVELHDKFQTPNVNNQRLSVGMTPKTLRLPKPGEMLLSVHGSPLGVFKEDNMEAINEMEDAGEETI